MITLFKGCTYSGVKVSPAGWNKPGISITKGKDWKVYYRFWDPTILNPATGRPKEHYIEHKAGINRIMELNDRRAAVRHMVSELTELLEVEGYHPVTGQFLAKKPANDYEIHPQTHFIEALKAAHKRLKLAKHTLDDIKTVIRGTEAAAKQLRYDKWPVCDIEMRHIRALLNRLEETRENWSNNQYNYFRKYLIILFTELCECQAVRGNPVRDIKKRKVVRRLRAVLSDEQCREIDAHVHAKDYTMWRFIHLFFHSGARLTELFRLQVKDVNLAKQEVKYLILKGDTPEESLRAIKDVALPFWQELLRGARSEDYLFSRDLEPGKKPVKPEVVTRRWNRLVKAPKPKGGLGISCDLYSLKHLNTTQTVEMITDMLRQPEELATIQTGHKSTAMVSGVYNVRSDEQKRKLVRGVGNIFGSAVKGSPDEAAAG